MKIRKIFLYLAFGCAFSIGAQELHVHSNAASVANEANSTAGWAGSATLSSIATEPQQGNFSIRAVSTNTNGIRVDYYFNAQVGEEYVIRIWAKQGPQVSVPNAPAFANWNGVAGFSTTLITGTTWTEYVFNVTANIPRPRISIYTGPNSTGSTAGNTVDIDNVSILPAGFADTASPNAVTDVSSGNTTQTGTQLTWSDPGDNVGVTDYEVFQDGASLGLTGGATTFNVTGLAASTSYAFTVTARDAAGNTSPAGNTANVTTLDAADGVPPNAVTDVSSGNTTQTGTQLTWSDPGDNVGVTDYEVFQDGASLGLTGGATTFNVTGLAASTSYAFTVTARDAAGNTSPAGNTANVTTLDAADGVPPNAVTDVSSGNTTQTGTQLTWSDPGDNVGVTDYEVFQDGASLGLTGGATTFNVTGLTASTSYAFTVTARDAAGNTSPAGNTANVTTLDAADGVPPNAVTDVSSGNTTQTGTQLTWSDPGDNVGVTDYEVFQDGASLGLTGGATTFNVTGLAASTSYAFTVTARDAAGNTSPAGNTANVTTLDAADGVPPNAVTDVSSGNTTQTGTQLTWSDPGDNVGVTDYEVFQDGASLGLTGGATTFNVTGLAASTSYAFTVTARDAAGNTSPAGNTANVTTLDAADGVPPNAVTDVSSGNTTQTGTQLTWSDPGDNVGVTDYEVFQDGASLGLTGGATTFNVTGLAASTSYAFTVTARDAAGNTSPAGNTANVTTLDLGPGVTDYTSENSNLLTVDWQARDLFADGNLGVGTTDTQGYRLAVAGSVIAESVKVELQVNWPDFVFTGKYGLPTLKEVEDHIRAKGHLLNIPSAEEVERDGINLGEMNAKLLQKIEELTLYTIQQEKKIQELELQNQRMEEVFGEKLMELEKEVKKNH